MGRAIPRGVFPLLAGLLLAAALRAQNGSNYHVLTNGGDTIFRGVGAGGAQTAPADCMATFIAGEDLRGSHRVAWSGDFGYRQSGVVEQVCVPVAGPGPLALKFPLIAFIEMDGMNGNDPLVFTNPKCSPPSFPLGSSGFVPYGTPAGSSASFLFTNFPSGAGLPQGITALFPNNGIVPSMGGYKSLIAAAAFSLPIASTGFCWGVTLNWVPSALASSDDIDGWVHSLSVSPDLNQYWMFSDNEENIWQSQSVASDAGATALQTFFANDDYALTFLEPEPVTLATLAPRAGVTPYSAWTANVSNEYGVVLDPNGGFDVGRGSSAISFGGHAGVPNPATGVGNQDPTLGPGSTPTLGFATWDNGGDFNGSVRLVWVSIDTAELLGLNPAQDPGVLVFGGATRVPVVSTGLVQPITSLGFSLVGHVTRPGFVSPFPTFSSPTTIGGASWQMSTAMLSVPCLFGATIELTYGSSGRLGTLGAPGKLTFDPAVADTSGTRQIFLFD